MIEHSVSLVLLTILVVGQCRRDVLLRTQVINDVVDKLIQQTKSDILAKGDDQIAISDLKEEFKNFLHIPLLFTATDGWFRNLSSIKRTGDVILMTTVSTLQLELHIGLEDMEVGFDHYEAKFIHIGPSGKLNAKVKKNSLDCQVNFVYIDGKCVATLDHAVLERFSGFEIHVTGLGPLNWLYSKITSCVTNNLRGKIKKVIEHRLQAAIHTTLTKIDICQYLHF